MKIYGSNVRDTLIGTKRGDTIHALGGNDLIATSGGIDTILAGSGDDMITGFSYKLRSSDDDGGGTDPGTDGGIGGSRAAANKFISVDGGSGEHDIMIVELTAAAGTSEVDSFKTAIKVRNVEEFIYNFASVSAGQKILGDNNIRGLETIVIGSGDANVDARSGDDFIYTAGGNDVVKGGNGRDFIHAGEGHNFVTGGKGADYFHFRVTANYQYTEITDYNAAEDRILISVDTAQVNLLFGFFDPGWEDLDPPPFPVRGYGDGYLGVGPQLNDYVSYNHGREFDPAEFTQNAEELMIEFWADYEKETGSIFVRHYELHGDLIEFEKVLVAHIAPGTDISLDDIQLLRI